ncbi:unnamed protein product [Plutella xylostella]|uniref:(diamondback moth) hypothetical protein n=1 Tax=Plutella xylostella TaxID=51655 RepID=A0A8S4GDV4_PLUXY|nr:unnamed protein product [Plutella xylostella]
MLWGLVVVISVLLVLVFIDRACKHESFEKIPGPPGIPFLENALDFAIDPVKLFNYFRNLALNNKDLFKVKIGPKKFVIIYNPEDVETLISGTKHNSKGFLYGFMKIWLKDGLLLSDGQKWHTRRKILTPAFHFNILRHFNSILVENCWKFVKRLEMELDKPKTELSTVITEFTLNSICETAMGTKLDEETTDGMGKKYKNAIFKMGRYIVYRASRIWMYPTFIFDITIVGRKQKRVLDLMSSFRDNVIDKRRESAECKKLLLEATAKADTPTANDDIYLTRGKKKLAMLDLLLQAEKEGKIDAKGIGEEVDTFMFEGHDTTSTALQMIFMLLANNVDSQDKIVDECDRIFGSSDRSATMDDLTQMKYLECCIKEGLRLFPPVFFIQRMLTEPMKFRDHEVPAGTDCTVFILDLHRRADQFDEPHRFRPERFLAESPSWHPYSYIPFSAGPRNCIGQKFAMMEMKLAISSVLRRYKLLPVTKPDDVVFITDFILRPSHPIYVKFARRQD